MARKYMARVRPEGVARVRESIENHRAHFCAHLNRENWESAEDLHVGSDDHGGGIINFQISCGDQKCLSRAETAIAQNYAEESDVRKAVGQIVDTVLRREQQASKAHLN